MAITRTGTVQSGNFGTAGTGSVSITVPAGATLAVLGLTTYTNIAGYLSSGSIAIGGVNMTSVGGADTDTANYFGNLWYLINPATGTQTLSWNWYPGAGPSDRAQPYAVVFYAGINATDLLRDTYGAQQSTTTNSTDSLTAASGDVVVAYAFRYVSGGVAAWTWSGATEIGEYTAGESTGTLAEVFPTAAVTVSATETVESSAFGGMLALVAKAAPVGAPVRWDTAGLTWDAAGATWDALIPAAEFTGAVTAAATVTATLTVGVRLSGGLTATATLAGPLTTQVALAGSLSAVATTAGVLTGQIRLAASPAAAATVTANLTVGVQLAATPAATATVTASLTVGVRLSGSVTALATTAGTLTATTTLAGSLASTATLAGALSAQVQLAAAPVARATVTAALTILPAGLGGELLAQATTAGTLTAAITLAGPVGATATVTGALTRAVTFQAAVAASATLGGTLTVIAPDLAGQTSGQATTTGTLTGQILLIGAASATAGTTATLTVIVPGLSGQAVGQATTSGTLTVGVLLLGNANAVAITTATLAAPAAVTLAGALLGVAVLTGALEGAIPPAPISDEEICPCCPEFPTPRDAYGWRSAEDLGRTGIRPDLRVYATKAPMPPVTRRRRGWPEEHRERRHGPTPRDERILEPDGWRRGR